MLGKRLVLGALAAASAVAVFGVVGSSSGQPQPATVGTVYGGTRDGDTAWLWLDPSRSGIVALEIPYTASRKRCTNNQGYFNYVYTGLTYSEPVRLRRDSTFKTLVVDNYRDAGIRYEERITVAGRIGDHRASGSVQGTVLIARPNRRTARCTIGPHRWILEN